MDNTTEAIQLTLITIEAASHRLKELEDYLKMGPFKVKNDDYDDDDNDYYYYYYYYYDK